MRPPPREQRVLHVAYVLLAMSGWRLDHLNIAWVVGGLLSLLVGGLYIPHLNSPVCSLAFYALSVLFYYLGNTAFLTSVWPARAIARWGEDRAYRLYETALALMFINQGLGVACIGSLKLGPAWLVPGPPGLVYGVAGVLCAIGIVVKVWATLVVGVDVYYYRDLFLRRPVSEFVSRGPYRVFRNPMYGIGQLHAYGIGMLLNRSINGIAAAALCHTLIYVFYFTAELPFVRRTYLVPAALRGQEMARNAGVLVPAGQPKRSPGYEHPHGHGTPAE
jgi:protein-S-isoprenylcysteine O-methyltransferase Ste14